MRKVIERDKQIDIILEYDEYLYDIEYVKCGNVFVLRRLTDNRILEMFSSDIGFIVQCDVDGITHFVVTDYIEKDETGEPIRYLKDYVDKAGEKSLTLKWKYPCKTIQLSKVRVAPHTFLVGEFGYESSLYNLKRVTQKFLRVYQSDEISSYFDEPVIMVSEKKKADRIARLSDRITYGINPDTFEIVTPIWSELQQRYINKLTREDVEVRSKRLENKGIYVNSNYSLDLMTILLEVRYYLVLLEKMLDEEKDIYQKSSTSIINEDFIKGFVKTK